MDFKTWFNNMLNEQNLTKYKLASLFRYKSDVIDAMVQRGNVKPHELVLFKNKLNVDVPEEFVSGKLLDKVERPPVINTMLKNREDYYANKFFKTQTRDMNHDRVRNFHEQAKASNGIVCPFCHQQFADDTERVLGPEKFYFHKECLGKVLKEKDAILINSFIFDPVKIKALYEGNIKKFKNMKCLSRPTLSKLLSGEPVEDRTYRKFAEFVGVDIIELMRDVYRDLVVVSKERFLKID